MNELIAFHFIRPWWLLTLIPWLIFGFWRWRHIHTQQSPWSEWVDPHLLPYVLIESRSQQTQAKPINKILTNSIGFQLMSFLAILALAGPTWKQLPIPVIKPNDALVIVLDLSLSMNAEDLKPSRLDRAQHKIRDILALKKGHQVGLVTYSGDAHIVTPLTDDDATIEAMLPALNTLIMPVIGSEPLSGIEMATNLFKQASLTQGRILLMTDGIKPKDRRLISRHIQRHGYQLSVLGIGTEQGAPIPLPNGTFVKDAEGKTVLPKLPVMMLQQLATESNGLYQTLQVTDKDIQTLLPPPLHLDLLNPDDLDSSIEKQFDQWEDMGPWLILLILPWVAWQFRRGLIFCLPILLPTTLFILSQGMPPAVHAQETENNTTEKPFSLWQTVWKRADQLAQEAYEQEDYKNAEAGFTSPERKALAAYHQNNFEQSLEYFQQVESDSSNTQTRYNQATTMAHARQFEQAIALYDEVLAENPDHERALHNKALLESLLEQQQQQNQQGQNQQGQNQQNQDQQSQDQQSQQSDQNQQSDQSQQSQGQQNQQSQEGQQGEQSEQAQQKSEADENSEQNEASQQATTSDESEEEPNSEEQAMAQQNQQGEENTEEENPDQQALMRQQPSDEEQNQEQQQALMQWLQQVPDDPSGLLRRKFLLQSQQRQNDRNQRNPQNQSEPYW